MSKMRSMEELEAIAADFTAKMSANEARLYDLLTLPPLLNHRKPV